MVLGEEAFSSTQKNNFRLPEEPFDSALIIIKKTQ